MVVDDLRIWKFRMVRYHISIACIKLQTLWNSDSTECNVEMEAEEGKGIGNEFAILTFYSISVVGKSLIR